MDTSIHIDGFKNVKKKFRMVSCCHGNQPKPPEKRQKMSSHRAKYLKLEK